MAEAPVAEVAALKIDSNGSAKPAAAPASPAPAEGAANLKEQFKLFSKFGDVKSDGKLITLSQSDKWMKQAGVIDKKITTTDTGIHFKKLKSVKVSYVDYNKFLEEFGEDKRLRAFRDQGANWPECGTPGANTAVKSSAKAAETVARLTDTSKYTGSHKERFDSDGKGKGISGRRDAGGDGYVSGYQNKNTFDKTH